MKKAGLIVAMTLALGLLPGCGKTESAKIDEASLADSLVKDIKYDSELTEIDADEASSYVELADGVEVIMYMTSGNTAEEVAVFTCPDSATVDKMEENVQSFLNDEKDSFKAYIPEEADRVDDAVIVKKGNYLILSVSGDPDTAKDIIEGAFSK